MVSQASGRQEKAGREKTLKRMGVQVWYERPRRGDLHAAEVATVSGAAKPAEDPSPIAEALAAARGTPSMPPEPVSPASARDTSPEAPAPSAPEDPQAEPFEFHWMRSEAALLVCRVSAAPERLLAQDLLITLAALAGSTPASGGRKPSQGEFRWPVLAGSGGSPGRTLAVFFNKQMSAGASGMRVAVTREVLADIQMWLPEEVATVTIPDLATLTKDARARQALWQQLRSV